MELAYIGVTEKKEKQFISKGIRSVEDLIMFLPTRYNDFSRETGIISDGISCLMAECKAVNYVNARVPLITAILTTNNNEEIHVTWFGQAFLYQTIRHYSGRPVYICGKISYSTEYGHFTCQNPPVFSINTTSARKIYPVYSKIRGMSEEYLTGKIGQALNDCKIPDLIPESIRAKYDIMGLMDAYKKLHTPNSLDDIRLARKRIAFDEILYFTLRMEEDGSLISKGSQYNIRQTRVFNEIINKLPYDLTEDQRSCVEEMIAKARDGRRISALVQGDVGCGKSIVAFLMAAAFAESGYQVAIMAPTQTLARQHFDELSSLMQGTEINCAFYEGTKMRAKARREMLEDIKTGKYSIIVGTHALISKDIEYKDLALTITDEEHKFGVLQKQGLIEKASSGVHSITMSATPIPRSLSSVIYGESTDIYTIKTMPSGRQKVKCCATSNRDAVFKFIKKQISEGHQAYVVCPAIEKNEKRVNIKSVEELIDLYRQEFPALNIKALTGKNNKDEVADILHGFKDGSVQVLVATTVIEVGVNVPNATVIVIENAENFGLAALHQLRGRVGRGSDQGYCIFFSGETDNERLQIITSTTDGFVIAEKDMEMRGMGEVFGQKQSGDDKFINIILSSESTRGMHARLKADARALLDSGDCRDFLTQKTLIEEGTSDH